MRHGDLETLLRLDEAKERGDVPFLLEWLGDAEHRYFAAKLLGELRAGEAVQPLIRLLDAGDRVTRSSAADALARIGDRRAVPPLVERATGEGDVVSRAWAIDALGRLRDPRATRPLCELLTDHSADVRSAAAHALGQLGDLTAVEPLRRAQRREHWFSRRVHRAAVRRLLRGRGERTRPTHLLRRVWDWREGAPPWLLPLAIPGLILGALGLALSLLLFDYWGAKALLAVVTSVVCIATGAHFLAVLMLALAAVAFVQFLRGA